MTKIKSSIATILCIITILSCSTVMAFAATGQHYYDSFSTASSKTTSSHLYGYRDIAFICNDLKSNNPKGQSFTVKLQTYESASATWKSFTAISCVSTDSGGGYTYLNANTNSTLAKRGRFVINKGTSNNYSVSGELDSYSKQV